MVRGSYVVMIFLPRILPYIEFVYAHCYLHQLRMQVCVSGWLCLYCNMTKEDLTFTPDFNMPASVVMQVSVSSFMYFTVYAGPNTLTEREQKFAWKNSLQVKGLILNSNF